MRKIYLLLVLMLFFSQGDLFAQHNDAGAVQRQSFSPVSKPAKTFTKSLQSLSKTPKKDTLPKNSFVRRVKGVTITNVVVDGDGGGGGGGGGGGCTGNPVAGSIGITSSAGYGCPSNNSTTFTLSGNTGSIRWASSADNLNFSTIPGATAQSYTAVNLTQTTYFLAVVTDGTCNSSTASVAVNISLPYMVVNDPAPACDAGVDLSALIADHEPGLYFQYVDAGDGHILTNPVVSSSGTYIIAGYRDESHLGCYSSKVVTVTIKDPAKWYKDADNDGYAPLFSYQVQCDRPTGFKLESELKSPVFELPDCDDNDPTVWQSNFFYVDNDGDLSAGSSMQVLLCYGAVPPPHYSTISFGTDCDDNDPSVYNSATVYQDFDDDGYDSGLITICIGSQLPNGYKTTTLGHDCNDSDPSIRDPKQVLLYIDSDGDEYDNGYTFIDACVGAVPPGYSKSTKGTDCNDNDPSVHVALIYYKDADNDGYSDGTTLTQCVRPNGYKLESELYTTSGDCNDNDPGVRNFGTFKVDKDGDLWIAGTASICYGDYPPPGYLALDAFTFGTDCDDTNPTLWVPATLYIDKDGDGYDNGQGTACAGSGITPGYSTTTKGHDCDDNDPSVWQSPLLYIDYDGDGYDGGTTIICYGAVIPARYSATTNGTDCNDHNAAINVQFKFLPDDDGDGYGDAASKGVAICAADENSPPPGYTTKDKLDCNDHDASVWQSTTLYIDYDGDGYDAGQQIVCYAATIPAGYSATTNGSDCNDKDPALYAQFRFLPDTDGDGYGEANSRGEMVCAADANTPPAGYTTKDRLDCNDNDNTIYPGAPELCDGKDNNCDGQVDEGGGGSVFFKDNDGDGYGNPAVSATGCSAPAGYVSNKSDCNDSDKTIYPGATEICDGKDNNCNGQIDEGITGSVYYKDNDGDGYGNAAVSTTGCSTPAGYVSNKSDCNDNDKTIYPGATELCDGKDNNCNGQIDEGISPITFYRDADGDGYGNPAVSKTGCVAPAGYVSNKSDCNDNDKTIYPGAPELCDGKDNNCNGQADEGAAITTYYRDADGDGYGNPALPKPACTKPPGYVMNNKDCNDNKSGIYPGAPEICNGIDDNCNGLVDEITITNLTTTNITSSSAKLNWASSAAPTGFQVNYKKSNSSTWQSIAVAGTSRSVTVNSLSRNQTYNWRIRALCGKNLTDYSSTITFKTLASGSNTQTRPAAIDETDVIDIVKKLQIKALPNPTNTYFTITLKNNDQKTPVKMLVADLYGRVIEERILYNEQTIKLGDKYKSGIYIVKFIRGEQVEQLKLIKLE